ncbi:hypothetical protein MIND_00868900 [Mycena indigotica]|uniref:Uncharacterized protein n=1 Tax=Mycena indigotica TaxID=2126181 RepID=A0A8H6SIZ8_9AGAR|nr:uncharacterized protein MIND_00868900 [Mycena indigotica]KAF7299202.1 hypothetical protein MIND_00868900 [Mycena indigotica]
MVPTHQRHSSRSPYFVSTVALWKSITGQKGPALAPEPLASPAYNISLNFTSLISFPSRILARIRKADSLFDEFLLDSKPATPRSPSLSGRGSDLGPYSFAAFFLSGYMLGLFLLAVVMHRIQNIVVPPRSASRSHDHSRSHNLVQRVWNAVLPLDLTRTSTRLAFQLPTLYFLSKQLLIWAAILLQVSDLYPVNRPGGYIASFGQWTQRLEMDEVCFRTFMAICAAFAMESFVRGLDGGFGLVQINANSTPFNLIGYSFLLHIYSSPITHVYKPSGLPSRPDKHVIVSITIPLLQLTIFHILSIRKRWSNHRLLPTALSSALALIHFHSTLYSHYMASPAPLPLSVARLPDVSVATTAEKFPAPTPPPSPPSAGPLYSRPTGSGSFPLLNYVPNTFETLLILTITLTIVLNALTQLILTGRVSRPLLGLGLTGGSANGIWDWAPSYDEDWGVVLLRVGTASLEATGLRGWGNELPSINASAMQRFPQYGVAKLGASGLVEVSSGFGSTDTGRKFRKRGLTNEIKEVDVGVRTGGTFGARLINWRWMQEAWIFLGTMAGVARGLAPESPQEEVPRLEADESQDRALYMRFLRQEEISDDENDGAEHWGLEESSEEEPENEDTLQDNEATQMYSDLATTMEGPLLLAHLTRSDEVPLTRSRYGALVQPVPPEASVVSIPPPNAQLEDDSRRNCVICTVEARDVICWPFVCQCAMDAARFLRPGLLLLSIAAHAAEKCEFFYRIAPNLY